MNISNRLVNFKWAWFDRRFKNHWLWMKNCSVIYINLVTWGAFSDICSSDSENGYQRMTRVQSRLIYNIITKGTYIWCWDISPRKSWYHPMVIMCGCRVIRLTMQTRAAYYTYEPLIRMTLRPTKTRRLLDYHTDTSRLLEWHLHTRGAYYRYEPRVRLALSLYKNGTYGPP